MQCRIIGYHERDIEEGHHKSTLRDRGGALVESNVETPLSQWPILLNNSIFPI